MTKVNEIWKAVVGYEGLYEVSNLGNVRSLNFLRMGICKEMTLKHDNNGYVLLVLCNNGKKKYKRVHQLVAEAFIPNPHNLPQVNHINLKRDDNRVENLEWVTNKQNVDHSMIASRNSNCGKTAERAVCQYTFDGIFVNEYKSIQSAFRATGLKSIQSCCVGKRQSVGNYVWRYKGDSFDKFQCPYIIQQMDYSGNLIAEYLSYASAERNTNINRQCISACCRGKQSHAGGFLWRHK